MKNLLPSGEKVAAQQPDEGLRRRVKTAQARSLRKSSTFNENRLWSIIRGRQVAGFKFRRQCPIGPYIVDFACLKRRLIVELDGGIHGAPFVDPARDDIREAWLTSEGYRVLRFTNSQLEDWPERVLACILQALGPSRTAPSTGPSGATFSPGGEKDT